MSQEFFTVTVFLTVSSLALGQYVQINRPEPNHCQLRPDRRRCGPTFLPRWYFNPFKGNCYIFQYGGCHGNRNNFFTREECMEKCGPPSPPNAAPPQPSPPEVADDTQIEAYVERCKAPADTGPCRARMNKWYYDAGKRRCFPFVYGGCGGNSNKYNSENECMRKCAIAAVNNRFASTYGGNGQQGENPNFRERSLPGRPPFRRSIRNPEGGGAFFRTFFPLIWQVSIPNVPQIDRKIPGSPKPENSEIPTTGVAVPQEVTTTIRAEVTKDTTTQPTKKIMATTGIQVSTTPPARLKEEQVPGNVVSNRQVAEFYENESEEDSREQQTEPIIVENVNEQDEASREGENDAESKSLEGENEEPVWRSSREELETRQEAEMENGKTLENDFTNAEESVVVGDGDSNEEDRASGDYEELKTDGSQEEDEEATDNQPGDKSLETEQEESEDETKEDEKEKIRLSMQRMRGPIVRFLFRSPNKYNRPTYRRMYRPSRPVPVRRLDYRKYHGPRDMNSEENERRPPRPNRRPSFDLDRQRRMRYWRERNRTPKNGISFTQVFVNKPPHPPIVNRHPLLPIPLHPYPLSPYHGPPMFGHPGVGYSRSFAIQGTQQSGSPPQFTGTYQASRWPASGPRNQILVNFSPRVGEPNLACVQPPAVYRCMFGVPSSTPFWYFDARIGKCAFLYFAGCGATLNRFNSKLECQSTCMVTSPRPQITEKSEESVEQEQSTAKSTESAEVIEEESTDEQTEVASTTPPDLESVMFVKDTEAKNNAKDESHNTDNTVEGTIELSKTHKIHILHELTDDNKLLEADKGSDLEYVMVVGIVCLSGIALLILVSLGLMYMFKKFHNPSTLKTFPKPKKETVIEAVLKSHMQANVLPKIICPVPLSPPQHTSL